jgi:hypothetical protein
MSEHQFDPSGDILQRAIAATRELPLPTGPSAAIEGQTLSALQEAVRQPKTTFYDRLYHMPWTS